MAHAYYFVLRKDLTEKEVLSLIWQGELRATMSNRILAFFHAHNGKRRYSRKELATKMGVSHHSVTSGINELLDKGLIRIYTEP